MKNLLLFVALLVPTPCMAQGYEAGKIKQQGQWVNPTHESAMDFLITGSGSRTDPVVAILRQKFEVMSKTGADALADELGRMIWAGDKGESYLATLALTRSSRSYGGGVPYARAAEVLINAFESFEDRDRPRAGRTLYAVFTANGEDYVRNLFASSEQPPVCEKCGGTTGVACEEVENPCPSKGPWCQAGRVLMLHDEGPQRSLWESICSRSRH